MLPVDVILVGDELLDGFVADANGVWLARRLHELGTPLDSLVIVRDERAAIADAISRALGRARPRLVLTAGGVGGTWDDITYEAIADALGVGLRYDATLAEPIEYVQGYLEDCGYQMDADADAAMRRIATIPAPAEGHCLRTFLACTTTDVDGGCQAQGGATLVTLPGPPGHLRALVEELVIPRFLAGRGAVSVTEEVAHGYPEHLLVGALGRIRTEHPAVAAGSYPGDQMVIRFQGPPDEVRASAEELRAYLAQLDSHPAAPKLRETWKRQVATWSASEQTETEPTTAPPRGGPASG